MAENRNDLELGTRIIDSSFVGGCGPKSQLMSFNFERNWVVTPTLVVRAFLSGVSETTTAGSSVELRMSPATPNGQGATFNLTINGAAFIDIFYIGYLVYDPNNFGILAVDGIFERVAVFNSITQQLPTNRINTFTYSLYGLSSFEFNPMYPPTFNAKVDTNLLMTVSSNNQLQSYFAVGYFLVKGSCSSCPNYPYLNGINCVQACPQGLPQNGICPNITTCPTNSAWNGTICICNNGWYNISGICQQCPPGTNYNGFQCINIPPVCSQNSFYNSTINQCQCNNGLYNISGVCQQCPSGTYFNGLTCVQSGTTCPLNSAYNYNTGQCQCNANLFNISGVCQQCPLGTQWNGQTCVQFGVPCGQNAAYNITINRCQCLSNYYNISGVCQQCPSNTQWNGQQCIQNTTYCPPNSAYNLQTARCDCLQNYYTINGACQMCPTGTQWNGNQCSTIPQPCGQNAAFNLLAGQCQCLQNYYNISGICQQCPLNNQWNGQRCIPIVVPSNPSGPNVTCPTNANCVLFCSNYPNTVYNSALNQCACVSNTYYILGYCQSCPQGWIFNGINCVQPVQTCPLNSVLNGNSCICINGYIQTSSGCVPGTPGTVICADGMYYNSRNQKCVLCPDGCASCTNSNTCKRCNGGYRLQNSQCYEICGDGIRFVLSCDDGNLRDGDGCSSQCRI
jgi:cysteine-rich repeat protein